MKKILIIGKNSFIGNSFKSWISKWSDEYTVDTIGAKNGEWRDVSFEEYDVILHTAGIAHVSTNPKMESLYYTVNRDLAIEVAEKAKKAKVRQFIFLSSTIVYGDDGKIGEDNVITIDTKPAPSNFYGKSKLEADMLIQKMRDDDFLPAIIRLPVVYGKDCKGNFQKLKKLAKLCFIFPDIENKRSMIFIDNLCGFLKYIIDGEKSGVFFPQNSEYVSTKDIIIKIRSFYGKKTHLTKIFNPILKILSHKSKFINKIFGNKTHDMALSETDKYAEVGFDESIEKSAG